MVFLLYDLTKTAPLVICVQVFLFQLENNTFHKYNLVSFSSLAFPVVPPLSVIYRSCLPVCLLVCLFARLPACLPTCLPEPWISVWNRTLSHLSINFVLTKRLRMKDS